MTDLSDKTVKLVHRFFDKESDYKQVMQLLVSECGSNIPFCSNHSAEAMERIRFSVLKISNGNIEGFNKALELAKTDWRDLFMAAGFAHDVEAHLKWYDSFISHV